MDPEEEGFEPELDADAEDTYVPEVPLVAATRPVDQTQYIAVVHDSFGERYVNAPALTARAGLITVLRVLGALQLEPKGEVQYFIDGVASGQNATLAAGNSLYIVGKLAGGR